MKFVENKNKKLKRKRNEKLKDLYNKYLDTFESKMDLYDFLAKKSNLNKSTVIRIILEK